MVSKTCPNQDCTACHKLPCLTENIEQESLLLLRPEFANAGMTPGMTPSTGGQSANSPFGESALQNASMQNGLMSQSSLVQQAPSIVSQTSGIPPQQQPSALTSQSTFNNQGWCCLVHAALLSVPVLSNSMSAEELYV